MAQNNLKLMITTALDNAGIRATKEQIESLNTTLNKANTSGNKTFMGLPDNLVNINGKLGKVVGTLGTFGKLMGTIGLGIEAFKQGWDIGTWINDKVITPLFGIKEPVEELVKSNQKLKKAQDARMDAFDKRAEAEASIYEDSLKRLDQEKSKVDALKNSYIQASRMKHEFAMAASDAETQKLERERFEDVMQLQAEGNVEGAEQANRIYDILKLQLDAKKQLAELDKAEADATAERRAEEMKSWTYTEKIFEAKKQIDAQRSKLKWLDENATSAKEWERQSAKINRRLKAAQAQYDAAVEEERQAIEQLDNKDIWEKNTFALKRATLTDKLNQNIDAAAFAYDQTLDKYGDVVGFDFGKDFGEQLTQNSLESYRQLKEMTEYMKKISDNFDEIKF